MKSHLLRSNLGILMNLSSYESSFTVDLAPDNFANLVP